MSARRCDDKELAIVVVIETDDLITARWFDLTERVETGTHAAEMPKLDEIIIAATDHTTTGTIDSQCSNSLTIIFYKKKETKRNRQMKQTFV